jgi:integrase
VTKQSKSTKTGNARRFSVERTLLPLLDAMQEEAGGKGPVVELPCDRDLARGFRHWLAVAGVDRAELHRGAATRKPITVYDLRATGITWSAIRGDEPLRIMQRAGHTSFSTTQGYIREAENVRVGFGDVFPPLPEPLLGAHARGRAGGRQSSANRQGKLHPAKLLKNSAERGGIRT